MLVANTAEDAEWPEELLQLRDRFTEKYEMQIANIRQRHLEEISLLKEEHLKNLNRARRRSSKDFESLNVTDENTLRERWDR